MSSVAIGLALLSALAYAGMAMVMRISLVTANSSTTLWMTLLFNVLILWSVSLALYGWQIESLSDWRYFILSGVFAPLLGRLFQLKGIAELGTNISTTITLTHPVFSILIAILFMGEQITFLGLIGALAIVSCCALLGSGGAGKSLGGELSDSYQSVIWPILASLCYGTATVMRKWGMDTGVDPVTGAAVTFTTSWLISTVYMFFSGSLRTIRCDNQQLLNYFFAGLFSSIGPVLIFAALSLGDLVTIAPIASTTPLFVLVLSYLFFRTQEIFTKRVVFGTLGTVFGLVIMITLGKL